MLGSRLVMSIVGGCVAGVILDALREIYGDILVPTFLHAVLDAMLWIVEKVSTATLGFVYAGAVLIYAFLDPIRKGLRNRWRGKGFRP